MEGVHLFTLKFHILQYVVEDVQDLDDLKLSLIFLFYQMKYVIEMLIRMKLMKERSNIKDIVYAMNTLHGKDNWRGKEKISYRLIFFTKGD